MAVSDCLQPVTIWLKCLGIDMDPSSGRKPWCRSIFLAVGPIVLLASTTGHVFHATSVSPSNNDTSFAITSSSTTFKGSLLIDACDSALLACLVHASLIFISFQTDWSSLWDHLHRLFDENPEFKPLQTKFRRTAYQALFYLSVDSSVTIGLAVVNVIGCDSPLNGTAEFISNITHVYGVSGLVFLATLLRMLSFGFQNLQHDLTAILSLPEEEEVYSLSLVKWKRHHVLLSDAVERVNRCFGPVILTWVIHIFVNFISLSFYLFQGFQSPLPGGFVLAKSGIQMAQLSIHVLVMTLIPSQLWQEAASIGRMLRKVTIYNNSELQDQVNFLTSEVLVSLPKITAMDYCDVNLSIIPTLIGTTLTYLIILCQFESSENV